MTTAPQQDRSSTGEVHVYAASVTAFAPDGSFDAEAQGRHFRRLARAGVRAIVGSSGAGEGYTLSTEEWRGLLAVAQRELGETPGWVLMGMESRTGDQMISLCELAAPFRPAAIHVYGLEVGHGWRATPQETEAYLRDILAAVGVPCVLCNQPQMNGFELPAALLERLVADHPQVAGVLDTSGDLRYLASVQGVFGERLELLSTVDQALGLLALGGNGFACSEANLVPELCAAVARRFAAGDLAGAREAYRRVLAVNRVIRASPAGPWTSTKAALDGLGLPGGAGVRRPRLMLPPAERDRLLDRLRSLDIPELSAPARA